MIRYISVQWVVNYHHEVMLAQGQQAVLMGEQGLAKLQAALMRPQAEAFGEEAYPELPEKAAVLLQGILVAHPFTDGNKRAAVGAFLSFLEDNGESIETDEDAPYDFVIAVTTGELREVEEIAAEVRRLFSLS